jgi:AraC-like DNA-binding protein
MHGRSSELVGGVSAGPDPLSEVLQDLRLSGVSYGRCELTRPWGIDFPPEGAARFHFVATGECWLHTAELGWTPLHAGDVALLPRGAGHALADAARGPTRPIDKFPLEEIGDRTYRLSAGGGGSEALLFCGSVNFEEPAIHPLLELMPPTLLVRGAAAEDATLRVLLDTMAAEVVAQRVGAATMLTRLADLVITRVIRAWVEARSADASGWLAAIRDPKIGRALAAIHRRPGHSWSVESLADVARASRSIFSERFTAAVGMPPARYLVRWRMHLASVWLRGSRLSVAEVAARLGYESEASFSRAFKRLLGVPPSALRRIDRDIGRSAAE